MKRLVFILLLSTMLTSPLLAQSVERKNLQTLKREIENRKQRQKQLQQEAADLQRQRAAMQKRIIKLAGDLQNIDAKRDQLEARLSDLAVTESQLGAQLQKDRVALSYTLAGLQALQVDPPPAFAVHSDDALTAIQGALVLSGVVPSMRARARNLRDRLAEITAISRRMDKQSAALITAEKEAAAAQTGLNAALAKKAMAEEKARTRAKAEAQAIARLVTKAHDLRDLTRRLKRRNQSKNQNVAAFNPPPGRFAAARGLLSLPVSGRIKIGFGSPVNGGQTAQGLSIEARPGAQITAPYDGQILYSGAFRQYGSIVILAVDGRYQMILAGMEAARAYVGQDVLAGEPLGNLPQENGAVSSGRSRLYMELRFDGRPIDPTPWLQPSQRG